MILKRKLWGMTLEEFWFDQEAWLQSSADISALRTNEKTTHSNISLPEKTLVIDLNRAEELIFQEIQPRTRSYIKKGLKNLTVYLAESVEDREKFYGYYEVFAREKHLGIPNWKEENELEIYLAANEGGELLHGIAFFPSKDKKVYRYRYGVRINKSHSNAVIFWKAIQAAKARGFQDFDFGGIPQNPQNFAELKGIFEFKSHFGGKPQENFLHIKSKHMIIGFFLHIFAGFLKRERLKKSVVRMMSLTFKH